MARMCQAGGQVAIVGQQQQPFGFEVEAADGVDVLADADKIDDRRPLLRIGSRGDVSARLVQQQVAMMFRQLDAPAVHADVVSRRVGFRAELADRRRRSR